MNELIARILAEVDPASNPYFVALRDGSFDREDFVETQIQFYFAVDFFSRPMAAVAAKIPDARQRVEVLRNVWEEHGEGEAKLTHGESFMIFLERLAAIGPADVDARALWPEVRIFNTVLAGAAVLDEHTVSVGMLGMIERMFVEISQWVGQGVVARGWLSAEQMIHYDLHEQLDVRHSDDFFAVLEPIWRDDPGSRYYVEQGLRLGATVFYALYEGLHRHRARRWMAPSRGPHTRS